MTATGFGRWGSVQAQPVSERLTGTKQTELQHIELWQTRPIDPASKDSIVEARNASGCVTTAELPIEVAQDSIIYSKWTEVLIVDNHAGLYTAYQWYQNGQPVGNEQVLHVPAGMSDNTYYCRLTLRDGSQIYTCEHAFDDFKRSAEHQQESLSDTVDADRPYKIIEDDHVINIRGGERYDVTGVKR